MPSSTKRLLPSVLTTALVGSALLLTGHVPAEASTPIFVDDFESGHLGGWTTVRGGAAVQNDVVRRGDWALRLRSGGSPAWVRKALRRTPPDAYARIYFNLRSRATPVTLMALRTAGGANVVAVGLSSRGFLTRTTGPSENRRIGKARVRGSGWHELQVHARVHRDDSRATVRLDGERLGAFQGKTGVGSRRVAELQIGDALPGHEFTVAFDDVAEDNEPLSSVDAKPPSVPMGLRASSVSRTEVELEWASSTDNKRVAGYTVYRDGEAIDRTGVSAYEDGSVAAGKHYRYSVDAFDPSGNHSSRSEAIDVDTPEPPRDTMIMAAGDIACDPRDASFNRGSGTSIACRQKATSDLLVDGKPDAVLALGDNQYDCGGYQAYLDSYDRSWGRVKSITHPVPGNHEYTSTGTDCAPDGRGYYRYFGSRAGERGKGYYSFNLGGWHMVALNSQCNHAGGCDAGSAQERWLRDDLAAHSNRCTLAFWHEPRYGPAARNDKVAVDALWDDLVSAHADVVLSGHMHTYARFTPLDASGRPSTDGLRQFIVGTGGENAFVPASRSIIERGGGDFGVLKLTLHSRSYDWEFVHAAGETFTDSGSDDCRD